ncbi:MAG: FAD-binding oxidoreductase, partial [Acidimicrobiia bacterium]|nr:FAD-binding oxidoreductase [Acidimicrobiia bacterium]NNL28948.1 FAD-binding oxidoreductase [Acidimicrobiia bacterium]
MAAVDNIKALRDIVGNEHVSQTSADRESHSHDESDHEPKLPDAIVYPDTTAQVSEVLALANEHLIPVVGWGAGTSVEGHTIPIHGGIVVDFRRMNRILAVHPEDFQAEVQPGVLRLDLEDQLSKQYGLFFPPDPGANASIGGMLANNAAGVRALRYGSAAANVLGLEVVLADGTVIKTGSRSIKQSAGYNLTQLFVGSEGTLGLITAATLKLAPIPEHFATATIAFPDVTSAAHTVHAVMGMGLEPAALELLHADHIQWMNEEADAGFTVAPSLMVEFTGASASVVAEAMATTRHLAETNGSTGFSGTSGLSARNAMWRLRHGTRERSHRRFPGHKWISMDASVPISKLPELISYCEEKCRERGQESRVIGHAGDGNIHLGLHYDPADARAAKAAVATGHDLITKAIELGGTCSGEHGIGLG